MPRWVELAPVVVLVLAFSAKAIVSPNSVRDVFSGTQAFLIAAAIFGTWVVLWLVVLPRLISNGWLRVGVLSVLTLVLVVSLVVPSLFDKKVVETLPARDQDSSAPQAVDPEAPSPTTEATPVSVATGKLRGIDHDATGSVVLYQRSDGSFIVGLENIDIEPGPDYKVYVVPGANREAPGDDGMFLSDLRGNQGTQYYDVPADARVVAGEWTVLIWCRAFAVPIANATPA